MLGINTITPACWQEPLFFQSCLWESTHAWLTLDKVAAILKLPLNRLFLDLGISWHMLLLATQGLLSHPPTSNIKKTAFMRPISRAGKHNPGFSYPRPASRAWVPDASFFSLFFRFIRYSYKLHPPSYKACITFMEKWRSRQCPCWQSAAELMAGWIQQSLIHQIAAGNSLQTRASLQSPCLLGVTLWGSWYIH